MSLALKAFVEKNKKKRNTEMIYMGAVFICYKPVSDSMLFFSPTAVGV